MVTFWAILTPLFDAPDETLHMNSAIRLAEGGGWPDPGEAHVSRMLLAAQGQAAIPALDRLTLAELRADHPGEGGVDQMTQHPPLYYAYVATFLNAVDFMNIRSDFALLTARLAGLLFVLPLPFFAWDTVRRITRSRRAGLIAAASLLAVPQLAHIMGSVSNDTPTIAFCSAAIWLCARVITGDRSWWTTIGLGAALALALFTKGTAVPLVAFVGVVMLIWPRSLSFLERLLRTAVTMAVGLLGGWWWVKNLLVYGSLQPHGLPRATNPWPEGSGPSIFDFSEFFWARIPRSFWGNFGWLTNPMPAVVTDTLTVVCLAVIAGYAFRRGSQRAAMLPMAGVFLLLGVALLYKIWPVYARTQLPAGMQGRYFFVVIIALIALSAVSWRNLVPPPSRTRVGVGLLIVFAGVACLGILIEFRATYTGVHDLILRAPAGGFGTVAITAATMALCLLALALTIRQLRSPLLPTAADDSAALDRVGH